MKEMKVRSKSEADQYFGYKAVDNALLTKTGTEFLKIQRVEIFSKESDKKDKFSYQHRLSKQKLDELEQNLKEALRKSKSNFVKTHNQKFTHDAQMRKFFGTFEVDGKLFERWDSYRRFIKNNKLFGLESVFDKSLQKIISMPRTGKRKMHSLEQIIRSIPFSDVLTLMITQIDTWANSLDLVVLDEEEEEEVKLNQLRGWLRVKKIDTQKFTKEKEVIRRISYHSVANTWITFITPLLLTKVKSDRTWVKTEDDDFFWSRREDTIDNIRGLLFFMIRKVYAPMLNVVKYIEDGKMDEAHKNTLFFPPWEFIGKSKKLEKLLFDIIDYIVYQKESQDLRDQFIQEEEKIPFLAFEPITVKKWDPFLKLDKLDDLFEKPVTAQIILLKHPLFYSRTAEWPATGPFNLTTNQLDKIELQITELIDFGGSFGMLHLIPIMSIVQYLKSYVASKDIAPFTRYPFENLNLNTLHHQTFTVKKQLGGARKSYLRLILSDPPYDEDTQKEINEILTAVNDVVTSPYDVSDSDFEDIYAELKKLSEDDLGILFRLFHRENYAKKPNNRNVMTYVPTTLKERKTTEMEMKEYTVIELAREYGNELLETPIEFPRAKFNWEKKISFSNMVMNITDYYSRVTSSMMVLFQIMRYVGGENNFKDYAIKNPSSTKWDNIQKVEMKEYCPVVVEFKTIGDEPTRYVWGYYGPSQQIFIDGRRRNGYDIVNDEIDRSLGVQPNASPLVTLTSDNESIERVYAAFNILDYPLDDPGRYLRNFVPDMNFYVMKRS